jgi:hypothetical protein
VLEVPSPKLHCQEVGPPVDASVNCTDWPATGEAGEKLKDAASVFAGATVTARVVLSWLEEFMIVKPTVYDPATA